MNRHFLAGVASGLAMVAAIPGAVQADSVRDDLGFVTLLPGHEAWREVPGYPGIQVTVVEGDPRKAGPYVIRVRFAPGVMSMPHHHPEDRLVTVIQGTWYTGKGPAFEPWNTEPLTAGSFMKHPAGADHFDGSRGGEVIVQIMGVGPSGTEFVVPADGHTGNGLLEKP